LFVMERRGNVHRLNAVDGGSGTRVHEQRKRGILSLLKSIFSSGDDDLDSAELTRPVKLDQYSGKSRFEEGEALPLDVINGYVEGNADYESGKEMTGQDGLVPCDLVGRPRSTKHTRRGNRRWWR
jgi:hypothetical protein